MSSIKEGFELPGASWNFNGETLVEEVFKWLENNTNGSSTSKNPWLGFYGTSIGQTMKKLGLLHFPPSSFAGNGSTKRTFVCINLEQAPKRTFKPSTEWFRITVQTVGQLGRLQPPTA
jgi:hypothetical protein